MEEKYDFQNYDSVEELRTKEWYHEEANNGRMSINSVCYKGVGLSDVSTLGSIADGLYSRYDIDINLPLSNKIEARLAEYDCYLLEDSGYILYPDSDRYNKFKECAGIVTDNEPIYFGSVACMDSLKKEDMLGKIYNSDGLNKATHFIDNLLLGKLNDILDSESVEYFKEKQREYLQRQEDIISTANNPNAAKNINIMEQNTNLNSNADAIKTPYEMCLDLLDSKIDEVEKLIEIKKQHIEVLDLEKNTIKGEKAIEIDKKALDINPKNNKIMEQNMNPNSDDYTIVAENEIDKQKPTVIAEVKHVNLEQAAPVDEVPSVTEKTPIVQKPNINLEQATPTEEVASVAKKPLPKQKPDIMPEVNVNDNVDPLSNGLKNFVDNKNKFRIPEDKLGNVMKQLQDIGVSIDKLRETGDWDKMLNHQKSGVTNVWIQADTIGTKIQGRGKLSLMGGFDGGDYALKMHPVKKELDVSKIYGQELPASAQENLLKYGVAGETVPLSFGDKEPVPCLIAVDKDTNTLYSRSIDNIKIKDKFFRQDITPEMKQELLEGKMVQMENLVSPKNPDKPFSGLCAYDANIKDIKVVKFEKNLREGPVERVGNVVLSQEQQQAYAEGKPIYIEGFSKKDKKTGEYEKDEDGSIKKSNFYAQKDAEGNMKFSATNPLEPKVPKQTTEAPKTPQFKPKL
ncbi:MAG: DUF3945 domain-containing protein [Bacteroidales bacterium]|jgi:hypothetical protein|nr:DUF3945 domain-containing protein [Bacteroidales bacterium]